MYGCHGYLVDGVSHGDHVVTMVTLWQSCGCHGYLIYSVSHGEHIVALLPQLAATFLHQRYEQRAHILVIVLVWVHYRDLVLRVSPERLCGDNAVTIVTVVL